MEAAPPRDFFLNLDELEPEDIGERRFGLNEERQQRIPENVFHPRLPRVGPNLLERVQELRGDERPGLRCCGSQRVEPQDGEVTGTLR